MIDERPKVGGTAIVSKKAPKPSLVGDKSLKSMQRDVGIGVRKPGLYTNRLAQIAFGRE